MKDRIVEYPNRYRIVPVEGSTEIVDLFPVPGEVSQEGTPLNKATLLTDTTAETLKLTGDPTVDDAFNALYRFSKTMPIQNLVFQRFLTSGNWTAPANIVDNEALVVCVGGAGGDGGTGGTGGSAFLRNEYNYGWGGNGGTGGKGGTGYIKISKIKVQPNKTYTISVGAHGLDGDNGASGGTLEDGADGVSGTDGGTTSLKLGSEIIAQAHGGKGGQGGGGGKSGTIIDQFSDSANADGGDGGAGGNGGDGGSGGAGGNGGQGGTGGGARYVGSNMLYMQGLGGHGGKGGNGGNADTYGGGGPGGIGGTGGSGGELGTQEGNKPGDGGDGGNGGDGGTYGGGGAGGLGGSGGFSWFTYSEKAGKGGKGGNGGNGGTYGGGGDGGEGGEGGMGGYSYSGDSSHDAKGGDGGDGGDGGYGGKYNGKGGDGGKEGSKFYDSDGSGKGLKGANGSSPSPQYSEPTIFEDPTRYLYPLEITSLEGKSVDAVKNGVTFPRGGAGYGSPNNGTAGGGYGAPASDEWIATGYGGIGFFGECGGPGQNGGLYLFYHVDM